MPGVGKSHLGALCIAQALLQGRNVLLERYDGPAELEQRHWYWLSLNPGCVEHTLDKELATKKLQQNSEHALYVADGCSQGIAKEFWIGESVTFCSPQEQLWRYFRKGARVLILTVPAVSLQELQTMRALIPDYQELDETVVCERFYWAGGSVRTCLKEASHDCDEFKRSDCHIQALLQEASTQSVLDTLHSMEASSCIPDINHIFHSDCLDDLPGADTDSPEDLQLHKFTYPCIRFVSMRVRDLAIMVLDLTKLANIAMACLSIADESPSSTIYWWEILALRFLQMGPQKLPAAFKPDKGLQSTKVLLNLPEATASCFSIPQETAKRCGSNMSVLLMSHWETEVWWQVARAEARSPVRSVLTGISTAVISVEGGRHVQRQVLQDRIEWLDEPMELRLPLLCIAFPPHYFDSLHEVNRPHTHRGQPFHCQEDVVHQLAVRIPLDEILKNCPYRLAVGKFKMDIEQVYFPEGVFTEACMEDDPDYQLWRDLEDM